ncbi:uncharacterized protein LOC110943839 [Helianthus annuus]|uniref:uncharacterized protein LOC110943839 n=1 Tax=Helianthus annuus TaxID=4232 RepID=UPI000B8F0F16|nr:uncharacterized protein LOC110943839 [Helianthus annuus]
MEVGWGCCWRILGQRCEASLVYGEMHNVDFVMEWSNLVPAKCNVLAWKVEMGKIPTLAALVERRVDIDDTTCILCNSGEENAYYLFTICIVATQVWFAASRWCKIAPVIAASVKEVLEVHNQVGLAGKARDVFCGIVRVAVRP